MTRADQDRESLPVENDPPKVALIRLSLDYIDSALGGVAASTGAVADEFSRAAEMETPASEENRKQWSAKFQASGHTVQFQTWKGAADHPPEYQSENPAWFSYGGTRFTDETFKTLEIFRRLTPAVRAAYRSYPYSWSYVTTAGDMMMIYPFLTLDEAVNNDPPTDQTYYRHADFDHRGVGWTPPYLDLVGAGMMVTASTPAYEGDTLLGVVSHDITLAQLSDSVLGLLARDVGGIAWLVDGSGLVIGVSDPSLARELEEVNKSAGEAVLHYRSATLQNDKGRTSQSAWINAMTEEMRSRQKSAASDEVIRLKVGGHPVLGGRVKSTDWLLIWKPPVP